MATRFGLMVKDLVPGPRLLHARRTEMQSLALNTFNGAMRHATNKSRIPPLVLKWLVAPQESASSSAAEPQKLYPLLSTCAWVKGGRSRNKPLKFLGCWPLFRCRRSFSLDLPANLFAATHQRYTNKNTSCFYVLHCATSPSPLPCTFKRVSLPPLQFPDLVMLWDVPARGWNRLHGPPETKSQ